MAEEKMKEMDIMVKKKLPCEVCNKEFKANVYYTKDKKTRKVNSAFGGGVPDLCCPRCNKLSNMFLKSLGQIRYKIFDKMGVIKRDKKLEVFRNIIQINTCQYKDKAPKIKR